MSVPKRKRGESQFEVFHHLIEMRREITDLALRDFGYDTFKAAKAEERRLGGKKFEDLPEGVQEVFRAKADRDYALHQWFIAEERTHVINLMRDVTVCVYQANSIYATSPEEAAQRRLLQETAMGHLYALVQELQYIADTLPVDLNQYMRFAEMVEREIHLVRGWRKSDSRKRAASASSSNFANVNSSGNASCNNASNSNGVRPDSGTTAPAGATRVSKGEAVRS